MKNKIKLTGLILTILLVSCSSHNDKRKGEYLGDNNQTDSLQVFAEGMISTGMYERDIVFSKDGKEVFWGLFVNGISTILYSKQIDGIWSEPEVAPFASDPKFFYLEPALSPDSKKIYFLSTKNPPNKEPLPGWQHQNIWCAEKDEKGNWQEAYILPAPINSEANEYFPSVADDGTLYFTRVPKRSRDTKLYKAEIVDGQYQEPVLLPEAINGKGNPYNAFISPDESFLISCISNHPDSKIRDSDYILYEKNENGKWDEGKLLGEKINWPGYNAVSTSISQDGKYIFFSIEENSEMANYEVKSFMDRYFSTKNGKSNIYWINKAKL